nr:uncharacterized protein LOC109147995 [Ipomoea batatas]GMD88382.1 uncharacterized protein LOC109147995 [Ipomoea batatas]
MKYSLLCPSTSTPPSLSKFPHTTFPAQFSQYLPPYRRITRRAFAAMASCSSQVPSHTVRTVTISYTELKDKNADLSEKIEEGFGPNSLGILSISDVRK